MQKNLLRFQSDKKFLYMDKETLNLCLNYNFNLPWQIAMLEVVDDKIVGSHDLLLKWKTDLKISSEAAIITRYSQEKVDRLGISPEEAFNLIEEKVNWCDYIIGHNFLGFDIYLLYELYKVFGKDPRGIVKKVIDTNCIAKAIKLSLLPSVGENLINFQYRMQGIRQKGLKTKLEIIAKENGIDHDYANLHDAIVDLELNKKVWDKLKHQIDI